MASERTCLTIRRWSDPGRYDGSGSGGCQALIADKPMFPFGYSFFGSLSYVSNSRTVVQNVKDWFRHLCYLYWSKYSTDLGEKNAKLFSVSHKQKWVNRNNGSTIAFNRRCNVCSIVAGPSCSILWWEKGSYYEGLVLSAVDNISSLKEEGWGLFSALWLDTTDHRSSPPGRELYLPKPKRTRERYPL